jgi:hypothetical protein
MSRARLTTDLAVVTIYIGIVAVLYRFDFPVVLALFAIPWSVPLMALSGLILHMAIYGGSILKIGSIVGALLNALLFLLLRNRR